MESRDVSGGEIVSVLQRFGYRHDRTRGSHAILTYTHPETGANERLRSQRTIVACGGITRTSEAMSSAVPLHDRIRIGTLQQIADQCGAKDFRAWCEWIDDHR